MRMEEESRCEERESVVDSDRDEESAYQVDIKMAIQNDQKTPVLNIRRSPPGISVPLSCLARASCSNTDGTSVLPATAGLATNCASWTG
jgi:hypothetical protein